MRVIEHFCDQTQAERLAKLGLRQDGHFHYHRNTGPFTGRATNGLERVRAFILTEFLAIIPPTIHIAGDGGYQFFQFKRCESKDGETLCAYSFEYLAYEGNKTMVAFRFMSQSAAAAAAEIVITLLETKLLGVREANEIIGESD